MRKRHFLLFFGAAAGLIIPLGRLLFRAYSSRQAWWDKWLTSEFNQHLASYVVIGLVAMMVLGLAGYLMGAESDRREEETRHYRETHFELAQQAHTDPLTGLLNPRGIHQQLEIELENCGRSGLSCLLIDIDHFKKINDTKGHPFGDTVIETVAGVLKHAVRRIDAVGRLGGEEFIILLPGIKNEEAREVAERVREAVQDQLILFEEKRVPVTISVGVSTVGVDGRKGKDVLLKSADNALYQAKNAGRNRVAIWDKAA